MVVSFVCLYALRVLPLAKSLFPEVSLSFAPIRGEEEKGTYEEEEVLFGGR